LFKCTLARFKNSIEISVSRNDYDEFHKEVLKQYLQDKGFTYVLKEGKKVVYTPEGLQIIYLKIPYSVVLDEVFVAKDYGSYDLKGHVVIDAGTYMAESAIYFAMHGASKVYGFEIDRENYNIGQENVKLNNMTDKIYLYHQTATYESIRNLITHYDLKNIFLKIDCEGCEYKILENADCLTFEKITDVVLEYHRQPEPLMQKLIKLGFGVKRKGVIMFKHTPGIIYATRKTG
jgi:hypothetical protein